MRVVEEDVSFRTKMLEIAATLPDVIALGRGKKSHDKRDTQKERDWDRQKQRIIRDNVKQ